MWATGLSDSARRSRPVTRRGPRHALCLPPLPPREKPQPRDGAEAGVADRDLWANGCTLKARAQLLDLFRPRSLRSPPAQCPFLPFLLHDAGWGCVRSGTEGELVWLEPRGSVSGQLRRGALASAARRSVCGDGNGPRLHCHSHVTEGLKHRNWTSSTA